MLMSEPGGIANAKNSSRQIGEEVNMQSQIRLTPRKITKNDRCCNENQPQKYGLNGLLRSKL
jgi:hypothetical protein